MLNDATCFQAVYIVCGLSSAYFYPQLFIFYYNYSVYIFKAEDNYYLTPQILANSSSLSIHSAASDISTLPFSIAVFNISIDGDGIYTSCLSRSMSEYSGYKFKFNTTLI